MDPSFEEYTFYLYHHRLAKMLKIPPCVGIKLRNAAGSAMYILEGNSLSPKNKYNTFNREIGKIEPETLLTNQHKIAREIGKLYLDQDFDEILRMILYYKKNDGFY